FGATISHSTPHLYLSALPLTPTESRMFKMFAAKFPCTPQVIAGHVTVVINPPPFQGHTASIQCIAISPDGQYVVSGSADMTILIWGAKTRSGKALLVLRYHSARHTDVVRSVVFSPDGRRVMSGSDDMTIRVWDAYTRRALGNPFRGHTACIDCCLLTRCVWDAKTGEALGDPLKGTAATFYPIHRQIYI
ncbi:WD40 repeat-like protein, partial [Rhizopogon vinicolor AM-OR11-026]